MPNFVGDMKAERSYDRSWRGIQTYKFDRTANECLSYRKRSE